MSKKIPQKQRPPKKEEAPGMNAYVKYSALGFQMLAVMGIGVYGGLKLDEYFQLSFPVFLVSLSSISMIAAIFFAIKGLPKE